MKTVTLNLRITPQLQAELEAEAQRRGVTVSEVARDRLGGANTPGGTPEPELDVAHILNESTKVGPPMTAQDVLGAAQGVGEVAGNDNLESPREVRSAKPNASPAPCLHPKARLRPVVGGKRCLDCQELLSG